MSFDEELQVSAKSFYWYCLLFYYKQAGYLYVFTAKPLPRYSSMFADCLLVREGAILLGAWG